MNLDRADSFLLLIDLQARLVPAVTNPENVVANCLRLMKAAELLAVPAFLTEHCADKIGETVEVLRTHAKEEQILRKQHFSAWREPACQARLAGLERRTPVIAGMEAHVCVLQTTLDLKANGYEPRLVIDAISTRNPTDLAVAAERARLNGIETVTVEMVLFEWLERGDTAGFRDVLALIKGG